MARSTVHGDDVALGAGGVMFIAGIGAGVVGAPQGAYLFLMIMPLLIMLAQAARVVATDETRSAPPSPDRATDVPRARLVLGDYRCPHFGSSDTRGRAVAPATTGRGLRIDPRLN
jgi:uncharacterized membrane protein